MKTTVSILVVAMIALFTSCSSAHSQTSQTKLSVAQFSEKIKSLPEAPVIDVRTPGEFAQGHLLNALNYDWNGGNFEQQISHLDKNKPVFVYCQSGRRSASAAAKMRELGFKEVYELDGGIIAWRNANLPETR